ncbi:gliding motility protein GldN [Bacteroidota bacterium]
MKAMKYLFVVVFLGAGIALFGQNQTPTTSIAPGNISMMSPAPIVAPEDVYTRENIIPEKKPVPYPYLREADVMWAQDVWRIIDLRQRMNYPLRYPETDPIENRYSLYLLLMEGIKEGSITPYESNENWNNPFQNRTTKDQIYEKIKATDLWNDDSTELIFSDIRGSYVKQFFVKEKWYFDKQHSEMRVRIVALAPLLVLPNPQSPIDDRIVPFYVYFPECRRMFATHPVFNPNNDAQRISFDDLFMQRRFASTIAGESNIHQNRLIIDFMSGQDALMEAERIKNEIFIQEHDLWEY